MCIRDRLTGACTSTPSGPSPSGSDAAGGTLRLLYDKSITTWDPQRMYAGPEGAIAVRLFTRTLTGYPAGGVGGVGGLVGDLATDTGTPSEGGKTWTFTIRTGPSWEDGRPVTCQDVAYGIARSFARDQLPGGTPYPMMLLDIPSRVDSSGREVPGYAGPYAGSASDATANPSATESTATQTGTATATGTASARACRTAGLLITGLLTLGWSSSTVPEKGLERRALTPESPCRAASLGLGRSAIPIAV